MNGIWILFGLAIAVCGVTAQSDEAGFPDDWQNDYDSQWYDDQIEKLGLLSNDDQQNQENDSHQNEGFDASDVNADEKVKEEIHQFHEESKELNDYQIEDNRSKLAAEYDYDDEQNNEPKNADEDSFDEESPVADEQIEQKADNFHEVIEEPEVNDLREKNEQNFDELKEKDKEPKANDEYDDQEFVLHMSESGESSEESSEVDEIIEHLKHLQGQIGINVEEQEVNDIQELNESSAVDGNNVLAPADDSNDFETNNSENVEENIPEPSENKEIPETAQETEQLLEKETDSFDDSEEQVDENRDQIDAIAELVENQDNFGAVEEKENKISGEDDRMPNDEDLAQELNDLFDKIIQQDPEIAELFEGFEDTETASDENNFDQKQENQPHDGENQLVDEVNQLIDDVDQPIEEIDQQIAEIQNAILGQDEQTNEHEENIDEQEELDEEQSIDYDTVDQVYNEMKDDFDKLFDTLDKLTKSSESDETGESPDNVDVNIPEYEAAENRPFNEENILKLREEQYDDKSEEKPVVNSVITEDKSLFEAEVTSAELNDLMVKFALEHGDDLDVLDKNFDRNVAAVNIKITTDEATIVTSPNYPDPYPTNNIIDWIFEGEGTGIELNVTDFSVNGFIGDYLLVKPGGIDDAGHDGLIFSYNLNTARKYRFLDVNRMFVRFEAKAGMPFTRGFSFSVKMITPPTEETEEIPETEALVEPPQETLLVYVAGVVPSQFANISEEFRLIVADMATLYLNRAGDHIGEKPTTEVTQITQTAACNTNWPGFERCTAVRFGIPLSLPEDDEYKMSQEDLSDMWYNMLAEDPFLARMRRLGITEFAVPNEESTMLVWVVISVGVVISAAMLGLALWRWSCFEDYTRMAPYSDTDSVLDKKQPLELYPAPHQHLPALYDDDFVKYDYDTTRVDMGGYTNQSYSRDAELFDIDSDDDVRALPNTKRDRFTTDV